MARYTRGIGKCWGDKWRSRDGTELQNHFDDKTRLHFAESPRSKNWPLKSLSMNIPVEDFVSDSFTRACRVVYLYEH